MSVFTAVELLKVEDVAKTLNISTSTVRSWVYANKIPYLKFGGCKSTVRFNPESLNEWINNRTINSESLNSTTNPPQKLKSKSSSKYNEFIKNLNNGRS